MYSGEILELLPLNNPVELSLSVAWSAFRVARTQVGSVALVAQDHLTGLGELKITVRTVPGVFLLLHVKGQPH